MNQAVDTEGCQGMYTVSQLEGFGMDTVAQASGVRMRVTRVGSEASNTGHADEIEEETKTREDNECKETKLLSRSWSSTGKWWRSATRKRIIDLDADLNRAATY